MSEPAASGTLEFTTDEHPRSRNVALDGLRAFAVATVVAFHGGLSGFHGGFLGVDVFFVLSGFLITSLLVNEYRTRHTLDFGRFYLRRAKRLLPALVLVILAVCVGSWLLSPPGLYPHLRGDVLAAFFYVSNWHLMGSTHNYFAAALPASPLTHTWSLAIEEQFYIIWPLVVVGVLRWRRRIRWLGVLAALAAVGSGAEMWFGYRHGWSTDRLYYGTDTHAQGLLIGAALACALSSGGSSPAGSPDRRVRRNAHLRWAGPLAIIGVLVIMDQARGTSGWMFEGGFFALALCVSVGIAYLVGCPGTLVARVLSLRPIVYVGQISYGIYLWHYPLFHWMTAHATGLGGTELFVVRCVVTLLAASLSYHLVEMPVRRARGPRHWREGVAASGVLAVLVALACVVATTTQAVAASSPPSGTFAGRPVRVMYLGDSMMYTLAFTLAAWSAHYGIAPTDEASIGCGLVASTAVSSNGTIELRPSACRLAPSGYFPLRRKWRQEIAQRHPNVVVVLAGRWETANLLIRGHWLNITDAAFQQRITRSLGFIAADAASVHARLVLMTTPCTWGGEQANGAQWAQNSTKRQRLYNDVLTRAAVTDHASVFNLAGLVCPGGNLDYFISGYQVRNADGVHFAPDAAGFLAPVLLPYFRRVALAARGAA